MKFLLKSMLCLSIALSYTQVVNGQKACCAKGSKGTLNQNKDAGASKACCSTGLTDESTSGCKPSNCRGAKTKFGEAKVISNLRSNLVALKAKMENHENFKFSEGAISVHDIIGDTDEQSLDIVKAHVELMETEIFSLTHNKLPVIVPSINKAVLVKELNQRIDALSNLL